MQLWSITWRAPPLLLAVGIGLTGADGAISA
jgi:hypothetical protein